MADDNQEKAVQKAFRHAEAVALEHARDLEAQIGHPGKQWDALIERIQSGGIRDFAEVMDDFLEMMWCLDRYRIADAPPEGMGNLLTKEKKPTTYRSRMDGIYRGKGNWFAIMLSLLLNNRTGQTIRSRSKIKVPRARFCPDT